MRVLWFTMTPGCFDPVNSGSWIEALQRAFQKYSPNVELALTFSYKGETEWKTVRDGVTYYPIRENLSSSPKRNYELLHPHYLRAVNDFRPDIVQCFGTERWHYGLIAKEIDVPVIIHMMGFGNIIDLMDEIAMHPMDFWKFLNYNPLKVWATRRAMRLEKGNQELEREVMRRNHYFLGRTNWDYDVVQYFSPGSHYFHCEEAIRPEIYESTEHWKCWASNTIRLLTIGTISAIKGVEIMLRTAWLLRYQFNKNVEWRYTGNPAVMPYFERLFGIRCDDVGIKLLGTLDAKRIAHELATAEFYVHPSIIDNSPNAICEAQLIGTPVVASNVGGVSSIVKDGETGFLYPYSEPYALAFKIMSMHGNGNALCDISENECTIARERHNPEKIVNSLMEIYEKVVCGLS